MSGFEETGTRQRAGRERVKGKEAEGRLKVEPGRVRQVGPHVCVLLQFARRRRANVSCSQAGAAHRHDSRVREGLCVLGPPRPSPHSRTTIVVHETRPCGGASDSEEPVRLGRIGGGMAISRAPSRVVLHVENGTVMLLSQRHGRADFPMQSAYHRRHSILRSRC